MTQHSGFRPLPPQCRPDPKVSARREKVAKMRAEGLRVWEIAKELGVTYATAKSDSAKMRTTRRA